MVVHVQDQILSHHCESNQADITHCFRHTFSKIRILSLENMCSMTILSQWSDLAKKLPARLFTGKLPGKSDRPLYLLIRERIDLLDRAIGIETQFRHLH